MISIVDYGVEKLKSLDQVLQGSHPDHPMLSVPEKYQKLLRRLGPLNRVHNGEDMAAAVQALSDFCSTHLQGRVQVHEYRPGARYNHWIVPPRWYVRDFRVVGPDGQTILSRADHPLALSPFSYPADVELTRAELLEKTISRADRPSNFSFYFRRMYRHWERGWNISLPLDVATKLPEGQYRVTIDTEFTDEPMLIFEYVVQGRSDATVFLVGHLDHPGQVNDSLSGCIASLQVAEALEELNPEYTYRVWLLPEIVGSAVHLKANEHLIDSAMFAMCPNMTAHDAPLALCLSKSQTSLLDLAMRLALRASEQPHVVGDFHKYPDCGDEISFDTVGYSIPATTLSRIGEMFPSYHSSDDTVENFLDPDCQNRHQQFVGVLTTALRYVERNRIVRPLFRGNPCLSNPDVSLYLSPGNINNLRTADGTMRTLGGKDIDLRNFMEFFLDAVAREGVSLLEIAHASDLPFDFVAGYAERFVDRQLAMLEPVTGRSALPVVSRTSLTRAGLI
jgi:aminopeptidase-like protein